MGTIAEGVPEHPKLTLVTGRRKSRATANVTWKASLHFITWAGGCLLFGSARLAKRKPYLKSCVRFCVPCHPRLWISDSASSQLRHVATCRYSPAVASHSCTATQPIPVMGGAGAILPPSPRPHIAPCFRVGLKCTSIGLLTDTRRIGADVASHTTIFRPASHSCFLLAHIWLETPSILNSGFIMDPLRDGLDLI